MLKGTAATVSCVVSGLTKQLNDVAWHKSDDSPITHDGEEGYQIAAGSYDPDSNSQTTILTVPALQNKDDAVYSCVITSTEHGQAAHKTAVNSNIFSKYIVGVVDI